MKNTFYNLISFGLVVAFTSSAIASSECTKNLKKAQLQTKIARKAETLFKELYEDAKSDSVNSTRLFIPSAITFTVIGAFPTLGISAGNVSSFGMVVGAPGVHLAMGISNAFNISNITIPMVLGWSSQAVPAVYAIGHGVYRLFHNDKFIDISKQEIAKTIQDLEKVQVQLDIERAKIYNAATYSQFVDGLLLGNFDQNFTLKLYNNSMSSRMVAKAKEDLLTLQCQ